MTFGDSASSDQQDPSLGVEAFCEATMDPVQQRVEGLERCPQQVKEDPTVLAVALDLDESAVQRVLSARQVALLVVAGRQHQSLRARQHPRAPGTLGAASPSSRICTAPRTVAEGHAGPSRLGDAPHLARHGSLGGNRAGSSFDSRPGSL